MTNRILLGDYRVTLAGESWDALICDPPYSEKTHSGHNDGCSTAASLRDSATRRSIDYAAWSPEDARNFVRWAHERTRGWMVVMCDDALWPHYTTEMRDCGRYAFAAVVWYCSGSRVRMTGDGPASWVTWFAVSRPRNPEFMRWGALPGGYTDAQDKGINSSYIGGKPISLMRALVRDYSRPGDTVCDPCAGWGTTPIAARAEGRGYLASEMDRAAFEVARARLEEPLPLFAAAQTSLLEPEE